MKFASIIAAFAAVASNQRADADDLVRRRNASEKDVAREPVQERERGNLRRNRYLEKQMSNGSVNAMKHRCTEDLLLPLKELDFSIPACCLEGSMAIEELEFSMPTRRLEGSMRIDELEF